MWTCKQYAGQYVAVTGEVGAPGRVALIAPQLWVIILAEVGAKLHWRALTSKFAAAAMTLLQKRKFRISRSKSTPETASAFSAAGRFGFLYRAAIVYVLGAVNRPGGYVMQEDGKLDVAQALALSGGTLCRPIPAACG